MKFYTFAKGIVLNYKKEMNSAFDENGILDYLCKWWARGMAA